MKKYYRIILDVVLTLLFASAVTLSAMCILEINENSKIGNSDRFDMSSLTSDENFEEMSLDVNLGISYLGISCGGENYGLINSYTAEKMIMSELSSYVIAALSGTMLEIQEENSYEVWRSLTFSSDHVYMKLHGELPHKIVLSMLSSERAEYDGDIRMISEMIMIQSTNGVVLYTRSSDFDLVCFTAEDNRNLDFDRLLNLENAYKDSVFTYSYKSYGTKENTLAPLPDFPISFKKITGVSDSDMPIESRESLLEFLGFVPEKIGGYKEPEGYVYVTEKGNIYFGDKILYVSNGIGINLSEIVGYFAKVDIYSYLMASSLLVGEMTKLGFIDENINIFLSDIYSDGNGIVLTYSYCYDNVAFDENYFGKIVIDGEYLTEFSFVSLKITESEEYYKSENPAILYYSAITAGKRVSRISPVYTCENGGEFVAKWHAFVIGASEVDYET